MPQPDFQPTLVGPNVIVRPVQVEDRAGLSEAGSDPELWRPYPGADRDAELGHYFNSAVTSKMAFVFVDRATGRLIGSSRYFGYDAAKSEVEIGWTFIVSTHWGGATNREVKRLMLDHAFTFVDTVIFWVGDKNLRSQAAMAKIGGIRRDGLFTRELAGATPHVIFEIRKEWYRQGGRALVE